MRGKNITIAIHNGGSYGPSNFWSTMTTFQDAIKGMVFDLDEDEEYIQEYVIHAIKQAKDEYLKVKYSQFKSTHSS